MCPSEIQFLAVYGTLRRRCQFRQGYLVTRSLKFFGQGLLRGLRLAQCGYPAILEQPGLVHVEVFQVLQESIWPILDRYEGYKPEIGSYSLFIRKAVILVRPRICAWVYFIGREIPRGPPFKSAKEFGIEFGPVFLRQRIKRDYGNPLCYRDNR